MKLLENKRLNVITEYLTDRTIGDRILDGRVEAFSCKRAGEDKKLNKKLTQQYMDEIASSPGSLSKSPLGVLTESSTRRLLIDLIATLNASFPDNDFTFVRPEQFTRELSTDLVIKMINRNLTELIECTGSSESQFLTELWSAVVETITPSLIMASRSF